MVYDIDNYMTYTIKQLAQAAQVSVRTLHHYDAIGLLKPASLKKNGYRQYEEPQLLRLQHILFYKELGFSLDEIKAILDAPGFNTRQALLEQKKALHLKKIRLGKLIKTIDNTIHNMDTKKDTQPDALYDAFSDADYQQYAAEVKAKYGNSDAYKQSQARMKQMTNADMQRIKAEGGAIVQALADVMDKQVDHTDVQKLIGDYHTHMNQFYDCSKAHFGKLGEMYIADPRFTAFYDNVKPGLAQFVHDAIQVYCETK